MNKRFFRDPEVPQINAQDLEVSLFRSFSEIEALRSDWTSLLERSSYPSIYSSYDFCVTGWKHFHQADSTPFVVVLHHDGLLVAVFPLRLEPAHVYKLAYQLLLPIHTTETDKPYPLIAEGYEQNSWRAFAECLRGNSHCWDIVLWPEVPDLFVGVEELKQVFHRQHPYAIDTYEDSSGPALTLSQTWDTFTAKHRKLRKAITRINNKLDGGVFLKVYQTPEEIEKAVGIYTAIELKSWKAGKIGIGRDAESCAFYRDLSEILAKKNQIRIGVLYHGTIPISAEIAYTSADIVFFSHGTYDPAYKDFSPGKISTGLFIKEFLDCGFKYGDFLAGFADYLAPWSDNSISTTKVYVYNRRPAIYVIWKWRKTKDWLKEKYKDRPQLKAKAEWAYVRIAKLLGIDVDKADK